MYMNISDIAYGTMTSPGGLSDLGKFKMKKKKFMKPMAKHKKALAMHKKFQAKNKKIFYTKSPIGKAMYKKKMKGKAKAGAEGAYQDAPVGAEGTEESPMPPPGHYVAEAAHEMQAETGVSPAEYRASSGVQAGGPPSYATTSSAPSGAEAAEGIDEGAPVPVAEEKPEETPAVQAAGVTAQEAPKKKGMGGLLLLLALPAAYFALK